MSTRPALLMSACASFWGVLGARGLSGRPLTDRDAVHIVA